MITLFPLYLLISSTAGGVDVSHEDSSAVFNPMNAASYWQRNRDTAHDHFTCKTNYGRFAHPKDCGSYYECKNGWPTLKKCRNNQWYDENKRQCRDKRNVHCHKHDENPDNNEKPKENFKCPYIWGTFPHPVECSKYYVCIYSVPALFACDGTDLFHDKAKKCLDRRKVQCGKRLDREELRTSRKPSTKYQTSTVHPTTSRTTALFSTTTSHERFHCPFQYGRYPDSEDCSRFFECSFFIPRHHLCPRGRLYDERKEECRPENQVRCGKRPGGIKEDPEEEDKEDFKCPYIWGTFPHPDDCSKYIICIYNVPTLFNCRKNELFDAYHRKCQPENRVDCDYRINPKDLTKPPGRTTRIRPTRTTRIRPTRTTRRPYTRSTPTMTRIFSTNSVKTINTDLTTERTQTNSKIPTCNTSPVTAITTIKVSTIDTEIPTTTKLPTSTDIPTATKRPSTTDFEIPTKRFTTTDLPTTTKRPTTTDHPITTKLPTTTDHPITTKRPTTTDLPITTKRPTTTDLPITTKLPTTTDLPITTKLPTTTDLPITTRRPITTDLPITTKRPTTTDLPITTRRPTTTDLPSTTRLLTTTKLPFTTRFESTTMTVTKPNTPPPTECDEDDIECIIDETGDVKGWFECPERYGHFAHGSNPQLFIHCDNWVPFLKSCADGTAFSPKFLVCMWIDKTKGIVGK